MRGLFGTLKKDLGVLTSHFFVAGFRDILAKQSINMQAGTYSFDQLSDKLKEEAIEANRDINTQYNWYDLVTEGFKEDLAEDGVEVDDVRFSGFYSQGDGASFTGKVGDMQLFLVKTLGMTQYSDEELNGLPGGVKENVKGFIDSLEITFERLSSTYSHEMTCQVNTSSEIDGTSYYDDEYPEKKIYLTNRILVGEPIIFMSLEEEEAKIDKEGEDWRVGQCKKLYRDLETEYDYLQSDESVAETLESNGTEFEVDEDGDLI